MWPCGDRAGGEDENVVLAAGKVTLGFTADDGVGGGASKVLACVFRVVGESVPSARTNCPRADGRDDVSEVCNESFGRCGVGEDEDGNTESIVLATFFRSSDVWGLSSRCARGV